MVPTLQLSRRGFAVCKGSFLAILCLAFLSSTLALSFEPNSPQETGSIWRPVLSGWVYVLDWEKGAYGQILVVDPLEKRTVNVLRTGVAAEMVLAPDGKHLYLAHNVNQSQRFDVIDTATGKVINTQLMDHRWVSTVPTFPTLAASSDGKWIYAYKVRIVPHSVVEDINDAFSVGLFDVEQGVFSKYDVPLPLRCRAGIMFGSSQALDVVCTGLNSIMAFRQTARGVLEDKVEIELRSAIPGNKRIQTATISEDGDVVTAITSDATIFDVSLKNSKIVRTKAGRTGTWVQPRPTVRAATTGILYFGLARSEAERITGLSGELTGIRSADLATVKTISVPQGFAGIGIDRKGQYIYGPTLERRSLVIINTDTGTINEIPNIGVRPSQAIVAP